MSVNHFFDDIAIVMGIAFVLLIVWMLVFPGQSSDDDRTFRHR